MKAPLLEVINVGKSYRNYTSHWRRVQGWLGGTSKHYSDHWVLRQVSMQVLPGESVGILGRNGAGKSTLLKMIAGTLHPTEGSVSLHGRVSAILELGMGFNPEQTGRQNVVHALGLMGLQRSDIYALLPEIEAFSEIGEYFDQPLRVYSSGMQMRIAFAVATAVRPSLLIVDEALAVGDAAFQRKCFNQLESFLNEGVSLLFVSHDVESVKRLCSKALFLKDGTAVSFGDAKKVADEYEQHLFGPRKTTANAAELQAEVDDGHFDPALSAPQELTYGDGRAEILSVWLENEAGKKINVLEGGANFRLKYVVNFNTAVRNPIFAFLLKTVEGISLYGTDSHGLGQTHGDVQAGETITVTFAMANVLASGVYFLNCGVRDDSGETTEFMHRRVDVLMFKVRERNNQQQVGLVNMGAGLLTESSTATRPTQAN